MSVDDRSCTCSNASAWSLYGSSFRGCSRPMRILRAHWLIESKSIGSSRWFAPWITRAVRGPVRRALASPELAGMPVGERSSSRDFSALVSIRASDHFSSSRFFHRDRRSNASWMRTSPFRSAQEMRRGFISSRTSTRVVLRRERTRATRTGIGDALLHPVPTTTRVVRPLFSKSHASLGANILS